jgi:NitT/TauT family transport system ATP-binding protein
LPQPRNRLESSFRDLVERIYVALTARPAASAPRAAIPAPERSPGKGMGMGIDMELARVSANAMAGLIEAVAGAPYNGKADMPVIASQLQMEVDDLFPIAETLQLMRFAEVEGGDIRLTDIGKEFAAAGVDERKRLFQRQLLDHVPLAAHIRRVLQERANHTAPRTRFRNELEDHMNTERATRTLGAVIAWARFAEAFAYDARSEIFSLDNPT